MHSRNDFIGESRVYKNVPQKDTGQKKKILHSILKHFYDCTFVPIDLIMLCIVCVPLTMLLHSDYSGYCSTLEFNLESKVNWRISHEMY